MPPPRRVVPRNRRALLQLRLALRMVCLKFRPAQGKLSSHPHALHFFRRAARNPVLVRLFQRTGWRVKRPRRRHGISGTGIVLCGMPKINHEKLGKNKSMAGQDPGPSSSSSTWGLHHMSTLRSSVSTLGSPRLSGQAIVKSHARRRQYSLRPCPLFHFCM